MQKLVFQPGINRESTRYSAEGGWFDCDKVRFRHGFPEKIGGWKKVTTNLFLGSARKLHDFVTLASLDLLFLGTEKKIYIEDSGTYSDITPIRVTRTLGSNPIATADTTGTITVTDSSGHEAIVGDFVTFSGATAVGGITAEQLNTEHVVVSIPTANTFTVLTTGTATSSTSGGGASVSAAYQINVGLNTSVLGPGWGAGTWGRFSWGSSAGSLAGSTLRLWFTDNFGEDIICNIADGTIYFWDASAGVGTRAVALSSLSGASDVPTVCRKILVSEADRHVLAFGANTLGSADQDPLLIRWSDQESAVDWTPTATNTAGDLRLSQGSEIITAVRTRRETLVWTDHTLHSVQFIGPPYTFGTALLADNIKIAGPNTAMAVNDLVYWMGYQNFFVYDGRINVVPCTVRSYVFDDMNRNQSFKFHVGCVSTHSEIWWFYCSADSDEIDRYVIYNFEDKVWYFGTLVRTAFNDGTSGARSFPQAPDTSGILYNHENGLNDDTSAISAHLESADFDIEDGYQFLLIRRLLPDIRFETSTAANPVATFTIKSRDFSGSSYTENPSGTVTSSVKTDVEQYTTSVPLRARGRQIAVRVESSAVDVQWRLGTPRLEARQDGRR
jgi:hypothetical protein